MATNSRPLSVCPLFAFKTENGNRDQLGVEATCWRGAVFRDAVAADNNIAVAVGCSLNYNRALPIERTPLEFLPR